MREQEEPRERAEEALRGSESSVRAVFDSSLESFLMIDGDRRIQSFNRIAAERVKAIFGVELHQGDSIYSTVIPSGREAFDREFGNAMKGETTQNTLVSMIMDTSPVGIATVDAEGNITYANKRAEQILGIEKSQITTRKYNAPL